MKKKNPITLSEEQNTEEYKRKDIMAEDPIVIDNKDKNNPITLSEEQNNEEYKRKDIMTEYPIVIDNKDKEDVNKKLALDPEYEDYIKPSENTIQEIPYYKQTWFKWFVFLLTIYFITNSFFFSNQKLPFTKIPKMTLSTVGGTEVVIGGEQAQPYLIHFWSAWCSSCNYQYESMNKLSKEYKVITIAVKTTDDSTFEMFDSKTFMPLNIIVNDLLGEIESNFSIKELPTDIYVKANGDIYLIKSKENPLYITYWLRMWFLT